MTTREARNRRREEERKQAKLARKAEKSASQPSFAESPVAPPVSAGRFNPKLEEEFPREFQIEANLVRGRIHRSVGLNAGDEPKKRAEINRQNARHSTGPKSPEGKLTSSSNSLKHRLASGTVIIPGEDRAAFEALLQDLLDEHQPASPTEQLLVQEMAQSFWLTQRALRFQNECFTGESVDEKRLSLFLRYQSTYERAFHKALNTLLKLKKAVRGFVSQTECQPLKQAGFVSQDNHQDATTQPLTDEAAVFSEPKTQATMFIWHKPLAEAA